MQFAHNESPDIRDDNRGVWRGFIEKRNLCKSGHNFLNSWDIAQISSVLVSGMEGANFRPQTLEKHEIYHVENEERKKGVFRKIIFVCKNAYRQNP